MIHHFRVLWTLYCCRFEGCFDESRVCWFEVSSLSNRDPKSAAQHTRWYALVEPYVSHCVPTPLVVSKLRVDGGFKGCPMDRTVKDTKTNTYINQRYKSQTCTQINETAPIHKDTPPKEKQTPISTQLPKHKRTAKSPKEPHTNHQNTNLPNFKVERGW